MSHPLSTALEPVASLISLEKLAYDSIKKAILSYQLLPGEALVESELARQLGISKTPVRDALSRLENEGLVVKLPYKGAFVAELTQQDLHEIFALRAALEGFAAGQAALRCTPEDLDTLSRIIARHQQAVDDQDFPGIEQCNRGFHQRIVTCAGNQRLAGILNNLDDHLHRYRTLANYQQGRMHKSSREHERVFEALAARDAAAAEGLMRNHMLSVLEDLSANNLDDLAHLVHENISRQFEPVGQE